MRRADERVNEIRRERRRLELLRVRREHERSNGAHERRIGPRARTSLVQLRRRGGKPIERELPLDAGHERPLRLAFGWADDTWTDEGDAAYPTLVEADGVPPPQYAADEEA